MPSGHDERALRILFETYWSPTGWKRQYRTAPADLAYAIQAGDMFPPEDAAATTHDAVAARVLMAARRTDARAVADAFLASLGTRRVEWRSALSSYTLARQFPAHREQLDPDRGFGCRVCGYMGRVRDRNILNFERHKWGGVALLDAYYCAFDLEQFARLAVPPPSEEDVAVFTRILELAEGLPPTARARDLEKALVKTLPSNKAQREVLLDILGICGILASPGHPGFLDTWVPPRARTLPPASKIDWLYPVAWWRGGGVSREVAASRFPALHPPTAPTSSAAC